MTMATEESLQGQASADPVPVEIVPRRKPWKGMLCGLFLVCAGIALLWNTSGTEYAALKKEPWKDAFILFEPAKKPVAAEKIPVRVRLAERAEMLESDVLLDLMGDLVQWDRFDRYIGLSYPEMVIALDLSEDRLRPLLASGRLPGPGKAEVLAGDLARPEPFSIDGIEFQVVGTLKRSVSSFLFAYMLPRAAEFEGLFSPERGAKAGTLVANGARLLDDNLLPDYFPTLPPEEGEGEGEGTVEGEGETEFLAATGEEAPEPPFVVPNYFGGLLRSADTVSRFTLIAMALVAFGGVLFCYHLFRRLKEGDGVILRPFIEETLQRKKLFWFMHLFFYGLFFLAMWSAVEHPLIAYRTKQYIEAVFEVGGLGHVGAAYDSRSITAAAWMTFYNNYIEQTLGLTFLVSLFPIPLGLVKNVLSFLLVGTAMSPLWVGSADMLILHSVTMTLELEAYILACIAITTWPLMLIAGFRNKQRMKAFKRGISMLFAAMIFTGIILGLAAIYEAMTLIHMV